MSNARVSAAGPERPAGTQPVLIVGACPVGLALACERYRHRIGCRVVGKAGGTKTISKALIVHVRTREVCGAMGLNDRAARASVPMTNVQVHTYGRRLGEWVFDRTVIDSPHPHPVILGQDRAERTLHDRLGELGGRVEWETGLAGPTRSLPT